MAKVSLIRVLARTLMEVKPRLGDTEFMSGGKEGIQAGSQRCTPAWVRNQKVCVGVCL